MCTELKIAIAEPSTIVRTGLENLLKRLQGFRIHMIEVNSVDSLFDSLRVHKPDVLIINPTLLGFFTLQHVKEEIGCTEMKCVALVYTFCENTLLRCYDGQIDIFDSPDEIKHKLNRLGSEEVPEQAESEEEQQALSSREKEIVVCVVKGMTNREIADQLYLSTHTVITHRRNIARKLQIHSASGLTIYAIVNKLVELSDIKQ